MLATSMMSLYLPKHNKEPLGQQMHLMSANEATIRKFNYWQLARTPVDDDVFGCEVLHVNSLAVAVGEDHAELLEEELGSFLR
jgi:hypothetical protein